MKNRQSPIPFLLLNVLVSAVTVFLVLYLWDQAHPAPFVAQPAVPQEQSLAEPEEIRSGATTSAAEGQAAVRIEAVFGAGSLDLEYVLIRNDGETAVNLLGWKLQSERGQAYAFPNLSLNRNGAVKLYSRTGTDSVIELYWNSTQALWASGDSVWLRDAAANDYAAYRIP